MGLPSLGAIEALFGFVFVLAVPIGIGAVVIAVLYRLPWAPYTGPARDRQAAALLAIFLGTVGAHKWYLRRPWEAILYPIFFWTFVPTVVGIMEGVWYLSLSDEAFRLRVVERRPVDVPAAGEPPTASGMPRGWGLCPDCRTLNPVDARFCLRCGETIGRRPTGTPDLYTGAPCPDCDLPTVVGADHCTDCGAPLGPDPMVAPAG
jgi:hypothetical protein